MGANPPNPPPLPGPGSAVPATPTPPVNPATNVSTTSGPTLSPPPANPAPPSASVTEPATENLSNLFLVNFFSTLVALGAWAAWFYLNTDYSPVYLALLGLDGGVLGF